MARPKIQIDENALIAMAERGWSVRGIAAAFGVGAETIRVRYGAKIEDARHHGAQKLIDILWQRAVKDKSDRVLTHLADRILGKVPTKIELNDEIVDSYINQKQPADTDSEEIPRKQKE